MLKFVSLLLVLFCCQTSVVLAAQSMSDTSYFSEDKKKEVLQSLIGEKASAVNSREQYVIGHGDIVTVSIFEEGDMSASVVPGLPREMQTQDSPRLAQSGIMVMMDGRISLKEIGDIEVVGLTLTELADYLKKLYEVIYTEPIVTVTLLQSNSLRYTVMGEVKHPGVFFLDYPMTLVQAIARSGGFSEWSNKKITLVRQNKKERDIKLFKDNTLKFNYDDFVSGEGLDKNILIQSGDYLIVN